MGKILWNRRNIPLKNRVQKAQAHHGLDKSTVDLPSCVELHALPTQALQKCYWKRLNTVTRDLCYQIAIFTTEISHADANTIKPVKTILSGASYHFRYVRCVCHLSANCRLRAALLTSVSMTAEMTSSYGTRPIPKLLGFG